MSKPSTFSTMTKHLQITFLPEDYLKVVWNAPHLGDLYAYQGDRRRESYWKKLPEYLVARCPFCNAGYRALLDTHSLKYWRPNPENSISVFSYEHQKVECGHFVAVQTFVNLNGHFYSEFNQLEMPAFINDNGDIPFVFPQLLPTVLPSIAVVHSLPICELEHNQFIPHYSLYMITYYAKNPKAVREHYHQNTYVGADDYHPLLEFPDYMQRYPETAELKQWVARGKLQWLDPNSADLALKAGPADDFPYAGIIGYGRRFVYRPKPVIEEIPRWALWRRRRNLLEGGRIELL